MRVLLPSFIRPVVDHTAKTNCELSMVTSVVWVSVHYAYFMYWKRIHAVESGELILESNFNSLPQNNLQALVIKWFLKQPHVVSEQVHAKTSISYIENLHHHSQANVTKFVATPQLQILRSLLYCQITVASGRKPPPFFASQFQV